MKTLKTMTYFHATAVFEARGTSLEEADRVATAVFKSLRHNRIHYHEHDVTAGGGPYAPSKTLYFSVIAEFDVDVGVEDRAGELADEVFEDLATDDVEFIAFGLTQGEQRVRPTERAPREEAAPERQREARAEDGEVDNRKDKKRGPRSRGGRKRKGDREEGTAREERPEAVPAPPDEVKAAEPEFAERIAAPEVSEGESKPYESATPRRIIEEQPLEVQVVDLEEVIPHPPPPRSSEAMRITLALSFRASEFGLQPNGSGAVDREEFLTRALTEARTRHPELPPDLAPVHEVIVQPWGETILTLTWQYDVPVPSASEEA